MTEEKIDIVLTEKTEKIQGILKHTKYYKNGFLIAVLAVSSFTPLNVKGNMASEPQIGLEYKLTGHTENEKRWGMTFVFDTYEILYPTDIDAIQLYLRENCKWIGTVIAKRLTDTFGEAVLSVCKNNPDQVAEKIKGITSRRAEEISTLLKKGEEMETAKLELGKTFQGLGVPKSLANRLLGKYGSDAPAKLYENPFFLTEYKGVGFTLADRVAERLNFPKDATQRREAALLYVLDEAARNGGHTYLPTEELVADTENLLGLEYCLISDSLVSMGLARQVIMKDSDVGLITAKTEYYEKEIQIAAKIKKLLGHPSPAWTGKLQLYDLAEDQKNALREAVNHNVFILTGTPGTGKTFLVRRLLETLKGYRAALAAPTGKAAVRLSEMTGQEATTIHRLLEPFTTDGKAFSFGRNSMKQLDEQLIIIDESSMIDVSLFHSLIIAIREGAKLILVGDIYQLPPVGPGNVLRDLISSGVIPCVELTEIKRQDAGNIIRNCHRIKNGQPVHVDNSITSDFFFLECDDPEQIRDCIVKLLLSGRIQKQYGVDTVRDIQILAPLKTKTVLCCQEFNKLLQAALNPNWSPNTENEKFLCGDKIIQLKNDYEAGIINGDIGYVAEITDKEIVINFENPKRVVPLRKKNNDLVLAYAVTVHKYQGSEVPVIISPVHKCQGSKIYQRNLLYTLISRAQRCCILVGQLEEARKAIARVDAHRRYTNLEGFMRR